MGSGVSADYHRVGAGDGDATVAPCDDGRNGCHKRAECACRNAAFAACATTQRFSSERSSAVLPARVHPAPGRAHVAGVISFTSSLSVWRACNTHGRNNRQRLAPPTCFRIFFPVQPMDGLAIR